ncbi:PIG-L deacetylase family protein [Anaeroarcus burkinensis]|uniref:PIG-L deacetylase family protein n=1 Tax=Anaeroarcus burkinensis TaxID=82376 RepID=UPI0003FA0DC3|nr:PIG-L deacetylase family protein [Anaeroarcus burkinensis]
MKKVVVIAPHPDDETLGCGGTLLRHRHEGDEIFWMIVTHMTEEAGFSEERIERRRKEVEKVAQAYGFSKTYEMKFPTTRLESVAIGTLVMEIGDVIKEVGPEIVYAPFDGDIHSDHKIVFNAAMSCTKWFRYPTIKRVLCYEALSETEFAIDPIANAFRPNVFINITEYFSRKIEIMRIYQSELGEFPFPRSEEAMQALAMFRGSSAGCKYAESYMMLKELL